MRSSFILDSVQLAGERVTFSVGGRELATGVVAILNTSIAAFIAAQADLEPVASPQEV